MGPQGLVFRNWCRWGTPFFHVWPNLPYSFGIININLTFQLLGLGDVLMQTKHINLPGKTSSLSRTQLGVQLHFQYQLPLQPNIMILSKKETNNTRKSWQIISIEIRLSWKTLCSVCSPTETVKAQPRSVCKGSTLDRRQAWGTPGSVSARPVRQP